MKFKNVLLIVSILAMLFPTITVNAQDSNPIYILTCVMPNKKDNMLGGFHFGVISPEMYGKNVNFTFIGVNNPTITDFGLQKNIGSHSYIITPGYLSNWAKKPFDLKDYTQKLYVTVFDEDFYEVFEYLIPTAEEARQMIIEGTAEPCPIPWP